MNTARPPIASPTFDSPERSSYRASLRELRTQRSRDFVINRYPWEASIAFEELLEEAITLQKKAVVTVRILSGAFPRKVYGRPEISDAFVRFFQAGGRLRVVIWNDRLDTNTTVLGTYARIAADHGGACEWHLSGTKQNGDKINHLFIVNDTAYRVEQPHAPDAWCNATDTTPLVPARVCFNDRGNAEQMAKEFDGLWDLLKKRSVSVATA